MRPRGLPTPRERWAEAARALALLAALALAATLLPRALVPLLDALSRDGPARATSAD